MTSRLAEVVVDCRDPDRLARFWCAALDWHVVDVDADGDVRISGPGGPPLLFMRVPEPKRTKNRLHLDVVPVGVSAAVEAQRLMALGAVPVPGYGHVTGWTVLADPEGNELCVMDDVPPDGDRPGRGAAAAEG